MVDDLDRAERGGGKSAKSVGSYLPPTAPEFPREYQQLCLRLVCAYADQKAKEQGYKTAGSQRVRNMIMELHDSWERGKRVPHIGLGRTDIDALKAGSELGGAKFKFIDDFVRRMQLTPDGDKTSERIIRARDEQQMATLSQLYISRTNLESKVFQERAKLLREGGLLVADISKTSHPSIKRATLYKSIVIKLVHEHRAVQQVVIAYLPVTPAELEVSYDTGIIFYEGFIIPTAWDDGDGHLPTLYAKIAAFRGEFRGHRFAGQADGQLTVMQTPQDELTFDLDYPFPILSPSIFVSPSPIEARVQAIERHFRTLNGGEEAARRDKANPRGMSNGYSWKVRLFKPNRQLAEKLEELFCKCYKGRVF
jgi:hypothetical protein